MFERFTERARQVIVLAQDEARHGRNPQIGRQHILGGLVREEDGLAARALSALDVSIDAVRKTYPEGQAEVVTGQVPFTPAAKATLELSLREALSLGHNYIGTEHILLGLMRGGEDVIPPGDRTMEEVNKEVLGLLQMMHRSLKDDADLEGAPPSPEGRGLDKDFEEKLDRANELLKDLVGMGIQASLTAYGAGPLSKTFDVRLNLLYASLSWEDARQVAMAAFRRGFTLEFTPTHGPTLRPWTKEDGKMIVFSGGGTFTAPENPGTAGS